MKKIKPVLIFFASVIILSCQKSQDAMDVHIQYELDKATSVSFSTKEDARNLKVYKAGNSVTPVLGEFVLDGNIYTFTPIVAFTAGQTYNIQKEDDKMASFAIGPLAPTLSAPEILGVYPSADTIPENTLKIYVSFSESMQEVGRALDFISMTKNSDKKPLDVFLGLESELWNANHTRLTLWLDPGRIKKDLIPNKEKGPPLIKGNTYTITIAKNWRNAKGVSLDKAYTKTFYVDGRDSMKPLVSAWHIESPKSESRNALRINFNETLDAILAKETIDVVDENKHRIVGEYTLSNAERVWSFVPKANWKAGVYTIEIDSKLEDLAGNNLNHVFDVDTKSTAKSEFPTDKKYLTFQIQ